MYIILPTVLIISGVLEGSSVWGYVWQVEILKKKATGTRCKVTQVKSMKWKQKGPDGTMMKDSGH